MSAVASGKVVLLLAAGDTATPLPLNVFNFSKNEAVHEWLSAVVRKHGGASNLLTTAGSHLNVGDVAFMAVLAAQGDTTPLLSAIEDSPLDFNDLLRAWTLNLPSVVVEVVKPKRAQRAVKGTGPTGASGPGELLRLLW